jgi:hypothetical protein
MREATPEWSIWPTPEGTQAGPASIGFYRLGPGVCQYEDSVDFVADPSACIDVDFTVDFFCIGDDAGPP